MKIGFFLLFLVLSCANFCRAGEVFDDVERFVLELGVSDEGVSLIEDFDLRRRLAEDSRDWSLPLTRIIRSDDYSNSSRYCAYQVALLRGCGEEPGIVDATKGLFLEISQRTNSIGNNEMPANDREILNGLAVGLMKSRNDDAILDVLDYSLESVLRKNGNRELLKRILMEAGDSGGPSHLPILEEIVGSLSDPSEPEIEEKRKNLENEIASIESVLEGDGLDEEERSELMLKLRIFKNQNPGINSLREIAKEAIRKIENRKTSEVKGLKSGPSPENHSELEHPSSNQGRHDVDNKETNKMLLVAMIFLGSLLVYGAILARKKRNSGDTGWKF